MRSCLCLIAVGLAVFSVTDVRAETFLLNDGKVIEGTALRSLAGNLSIKLDSVGLHQLPLSDIARVEIALANGGLVAGQLGSWANGVYLLVTKEGLVEVRDGVVSKVAADSGTPSAVPEAEPIQVDAGEGIASPAPSADKLYDEKRLPKLEPTM